MEKATLLQHLIQKQCYSRPIVHRRIVYNVHKLNNFYNLNVKGDWGESEKAQSEMSDLTVASEHLMALVMSDRNVTYKTLLDHVNNA